MVSFQVVAILVSLAAVFAYINHRFLKLHPTVGIMLQALLASIAWLGVQQICPPARGWTTEFLQHIDLNEALFHWMLGSLLFAGALHVDLSELYSRRGTVAVLSILGTILSTFAIAGVGFGLLHAFGIAVPFGTCAIFGAIVSPTDPVAVMSFLKKVNAPADLEVIIGGESLFNDGIGVVLFTVLTQASPVHDIDAIPLVWAFVRQTAGGATIGLLAGVLVYQWLKRVKNYQVEVLLTLALALGGYTLADALGVSGPIAAVVAGLIIGNHGRQNRRDPTRQHLTEFWELVDETLNAILFLLVGLVVLQMRLGPGQLLIPIAAILIVLAARWFSVWVSITVVELPTPARRRLPPHSIAILTWGGLRGGLAIAMALSLSAGPWRSMIVETTYGVVAFSILVQGASLRIMFERWLPAPNV